jgi:wyosine [tRNA(Phe)-imidazoG37] synthetase (radical SAM superfamily)
MNYLRIYGPFKTRRLGFSLGIEIVPPKTCSLDCVYCEAGKTTKLTLDRIPYTEDFDFNLDTYGQIDYLTFSGACEPTLNSNIGEIIKFLKKKYSFKKICLITNSTTLHIENVIQDISQCDLILPSLDAVSENVFQKINRPVASLLAEEMVNYLIELRKYFTKEIWLEIFIIEGINDSSDEIFKLIEACRKIKPNKIQLNSLDRNGTENWVKKISKNKLLEIKNLFNCLNVEIIE